MARPRRFLALLLVGASAIVTLGACSVVNPTALRVGDVRLSTKDVENDLTTYETAILASAPTAKDRDDLKARIRTAASGLKAFSPDYTAFVLSHRLSTIAVDTAFAKSGAKTVTVTKDIRTAVENSWGGAKSFATFPKSVRERELRYQGSLDAMAKARVKKSGTPEEYFKANSGRFVVEACSRHILVKTEAEAKALRAKIVAGSDFAELAKTTSTDTGSGAQGGDLGCGDPSQFVAPFADAIRSLKIGELSKPVATQFGFHLIEVKSRKAATFAQVKDAIAGDIQAKAQQDVQAEIVKAAKDSTVDLAYGVIAPDQNGVASVVPAPAPGAAPTTIG
jgi:hypothetical protein